MLEFDLEQSLDLLPADGLIGRRKIRVNAREITMRNVADVLNTAMSAHRKNAREISYLYDCYRGKQDVRRKEKEVRDAINNKIMVNRANEIVTFKTAYLLSEPVQYISWSDKKAVSARVNRLNEYMRMEDKDSKDKEIVDWMHICGVGARLVLPDPLGEEEGAPFCIYTMDPRRAFVIYQDAVGEKPLCGVIWQRDENGEPYCDVYTRDWMCSVGNDGRAYEQRGTLFGGIPLVEYCNNGARMGAFETVLPILNSINQLESDALDAVDDFVNGFDVFQNCEVDTETYQNLSLGKGALKIKSTGGTLEAKVYRIASELNQTGVQTRVDDLTSAYLSICGMPSQSASASASTSDTGTAVLFRNGWNEAESRAKDTEKLFIRSERDFLRVVLNICKVMNRGKYDLKLNLGDIKTEFLRKNMSNAQSKVQMLCELLNNPKVNPLDAWEISGVSNDTYAAYRRGMDWYEENLEREEAALNEELDYARTKALRAGGSGDSDAEPESGAAGEPGEATA